MIKLQTSEVWCLTSRRRLTIWRCWLWRNNLLRAVLPNQRCFNYKRLRASWRILAQRQNILWSLSHLYAVYYIVLEPTIFTNAILFSFTVSMNFIRKSTCRSLHSEFRFLSICRQFRFLSSGYWRVHRRITRVGLSTRWRFGAVLVMNTCFNTIKLASFTQSLVTLRQPPVKI